MHIHWHVTVLRGRAGNAYKQCRCGSRLIRHRDRTQPLDYSWLATGRFAARPALPAGPGAAAEARAR